MKKEYFINLINERGVTIIPVNDPTFESSSKCKLQDFRDLKSLVQFIDFDCKINGEGGCKFYPSSKRGLCCCHDCRGSVGYFHLMLDKDFGYYSKKFSAKTGFWRKNKGCVLPHKMRSVTCLTYHCNYDYLKSNYRPDILLESHKEFSNAMYQVKIRLYELRKQI
jgi:hypothetical protein